MKIIALTVILVCSPAFAQLSNDQIEQRMAELNKKATTKPTTKPTSSTKYLKWQPKQSTPKELKQWINSFESVRSTLISETNTNISAVKNNDQNEAAQLADTLRRQNTQLEKVKSRYIDHYDENHTYYTRDRNGYIAPHKDTYIKPNTKYDERELAKQNEDKKEIEGQISTTKAQIVRLHKNTDDTVKALTDLKTKLYNLPLPAEYSKFAEQVEAIEPISLASASKSQSDFAEEANRRLDQLLSVKPKVP
jgi:anion-transporting  ArsA/GET3 family ATPase